MPRDGSGIYTLPAGYLATTGTTIVASQHNAPFEDVRDAITGSLPRNGAAPMTGALAMGTNAITGITTATASGNMTAADFVSTSDERLKENVETVKDALAAVAELRGVEFDWIEDGETSAGVIAQELERVIPYATLEVGGVLRVKYNVLHAFYIEAIKELVARVEALERAK